MESCDKGITITRDVRAKGDVRLECEEDAHVQADVFSASGCISIESWEMGIEISGALTACGSVTVSSEKDLVVNGRISALDVDFCSCCGSLTVTGGVTSARDVSIEGSLDVRIYGAITSADDIWICSDHGSVFLNNTLTARHDVDVLARGSVFQNSSITAGGHVHIHAGYRGWGC